MGGFLAYGKTIASKAESGRGTSQNDTTRGDRNG